jgi:hypothetical protein
VSPFQIFDFGFWIGGFACAEYENRAKLMADLADFLRLVFRNSLSGKSLGKEEKG